MRAVWIVLAVAMVPIAMCLSSHNAGGFGSALTPQVPAPLRDARAVVGGSYRVGKVHQSDWKLSTGSGQRAFHKTYDFAVPLSSAAAQPELFVGVTGLSMAVHEQRRLAFALTSQGVLGDGFHAEASTWKDTAVDMASFGYVAYEKEKLAHKVYHGVVEVSFGEGVAEFPAGLFTDTPRVMLALAMLDVHATANATNVLVDVSDVSKTGFRVECADRENAVWLSYVAYVGAFASGSLDLDLGAQYVPQLEAGSITRAVPFDGARFRDQPQVLAFVSGFTTKANRTVQRINVHVKADEETADGFSLNVQTWGPDTLDTVRVSYLAFDEQARAPIDTKAVAKCKARLAAARNTSAPANVTAPVANVAEPAVEKDEDGRVDPEQFRKPDPSPIPTTSVDKCAPRKRRKPVVPTPAPVANVTVPANVTAPPNKTEPSRPRFPDAPVGGCSTLVLSATYAQYLTAGGEDVLQQTLADALGIARDDVDVEAVEFSNNAELVMDGNIRVTVTVQDDSVLRELAAWLDAHETLATLEIVRVVSSECPEASVWKSHLEYCGEKKQDDVEGDDDLLGENGPDVDTDNIDDLVAPQNVTAAGNATAAGSNATAAGNNATTTGVEVSLDALALLQVDAAGGNATLAVGGNATLVASGNATLVAGNATACNATLAAGNATAGGNGTAAAHNGTKCGRPKHVPVHVHECGESLKYRGEHLRVVVAASRDEFDAAGGQKAAIAEMATIAETATDNVQVVGVKFCDGEGVFLVLIREGHALERFGEWVLRRAGTLLGLPLREIQLVPGVEGTAPMALDETEEEAAAEAAAAADAPAYVITNNTDFAQHVAAKRAREAARAQAIEEEATCGGDRMPVLPHAPVEADPVDETLVHAHFAVEKPAAPQPKCKGVVNVLDLANTTRNATAAHNATAANTTTVTNATTVAANTTTVPTAAAGELDLGNTTATTAAADVEVVVGGANATTAEVETEAEKTEQEKREDAIDFDEDDVVPEAAPQQPQEVAEKCKPVREEKPFEVDGDFVLVGSTLVRKCDYLRHMKAEQEAKQVEKVEVEEAAHVQADPEDVPSFTPNMLIPIGMDETEAFAGELPQVQEPVIDEAAIEAAIRATQNVTAAANATAAATNATAANSTAAIVVPPCDAEADEEEEIVVPKCASDGTMQCGEGPRDGVRGTIPPRIGEEIPVVTYHAAHTIGAPTGTAKWSEQLEHPEGALVDTDDA